MKYRKNLPGSELSVGQALRSPTRIYAPLLEKLYQEINPELLNAVIHVTGGGLTKVLRFSSDKRFIKDSLFETPPLFSLIQEKGQISSQEMYQVFNMGHRIELYGDEKIVEDVISIAGHFAIASQVIGRVEENPKGQGNSVEVRHNGEEYHYQL